MEFPILLNETTLHLHNSYSRRAGKGLPGLIDNWKDHVTGTIATAQQPIKSTASVTTSSASPSCHTASISTTSVGPVRTAINEKRRSHTSQPYADPPHATRGTKQTLPSRPKPRPIRAAARVKKTTNNSNGNDDDDYREEDDDAFAAEYGGMHNEDDSKEQEFMRSSCSNVNQPKAMVRFSTT
jgi:hypothetical protein